jgi:hypothetical protein
MMADTYLTVRAVETAAMGFKWNSPSQVFTCVEVISTNYGDFNTGFAQWVVKAKNADTDCTEDVVLTRKDGSGEDVLTLNVQRGHFPPITCDEGITIVNLDFTMATQCTCVPMHPHEEILIDFSKVPL